MAWKQNPYTRKLDYYEPATGLQGPTGAKGDKGPQGDTGIKGDKGDNGDSGIIVSATPPSNPLVGDLWVDTN
jgi:hypothetical protein